MCLSSCVGRFGWRCVRACCGVACVAGVCVWCFFADWLFRAATDARVCAVCAGVLGALERHG